MSQDRYIVAACPKSEVIIRNSDGEFVKFQIELTGDHLNPVSPKLRKSSKKGVSQSNDGPDEDSCITIGFDTEYVQPTEPASKDDLKAGKGKVKPVSYQVYCKLNDLRNPNNGAEWGAVFYPTSESQRFNLDEIISFAICYGVEMGFVGRVPRRVELISHFSRADMPLLEDLDQLTPFLSAIRGVFVTMKPIKLRYDLADGPIDLQVLVRDTILLTAEGAKRLEDLGAFVGVPKIRLANTPAEESAIKSRMDLLLQSEPILFERYALADAEICVRYYEQMRTLCRKTIESSQVPLTLSGIGVKRLQRMWKADPQIDPLQVLGVEEVKEKVFDDRTGRVYDRVTVVDRERVHLRRSLAIEAYHGGRNEQYWFGPGPIEGQPVQWFSPPSAQPTPQALRLPMVWNDFDLSSAYPTAMSLIGYPDWDNMNLRPDLSDFRFDTLGVALVDFEFPSDVRYPSLPIRTRRGIIFPRRGRSYCAASEISVAMSLGAKVSIIEGATVPLLSDAIRPFGSFVTDAIRCRNEAAPKSLENRFWKELVNSLYGKLAQGLRERRIFNVADKTMDPLGPSPITNAYFAAFVTGYVRALLAEIMNALPRHVQIFSCTTDGFLSNASQSEIDAATKGTLATAFRKSRLQIAGSDQIIECKHQTGQLLGWRTRGQATLKPGEPVSNDPNFSYVLAKAGIKAPVYCETVPEQNDYIINLFFDRTPETKVTIKSLTGIRDIILDKNDLVRRDITRRLGMEYDFKRQPAAIGTQVVGNRHHVSWSTVPWETAEQFNIVRDVLDDYRDVRKDDGKASATDVVPLRGCIMSQADYINFAMRVALKSSDGIPNYVHAENPDIKLLRKMLCAARHRSEAGLSKHSDGLTARQFAAVLTKCVIPCKQTDVENGQKVTFTPYSVTASQPVQAALEKLKADLPDLRPEELLTDIKLDLLKTLGSLYSDGRTIGLRLWKYPKAA
ncbi:DNA polymerase [Brevundimonas variabilis]|uniref:DNA-directed DNA polymerase n=1 Tax=Brevundimonas variabilis TaxID=74312 RepID=A0A7W9CGT4_9CAUL|nr:DNA polymerase [Brevundimonas variabilis]MBB5745216.1 hypothetical protein [Brevundimonas variabilis]